MAFPFLTSEIVRPLRVDAVRAVAISLKLQQRKPKHLSAAARKCAEQLRVSTEALVAALRAKRGSGTVDNRGVVLALVNALGALHGRLEALTKLDPVEAPESAEAQTMLDTLFPRGKGALRTDHDAIWIESNTLLSTIAHGGHADTVNRLAGDIVLKAVRKAHRAAGEALGLMGESAVTGSDGVALKALLDAVTAAISAYALQVIAAADPDDAESVREVVHTLDPIVQQRRRSKTRASDDDGDAPIDAPVDKPQSGEVKTITVDAPAANDTAATKNRRVA